jgi:hypothetical protein
VSFPLGDLPDHVTVEVGASVDVALPSYAGGGYSWSVECPSGTTIAHAAIRPAGTAEAAPPAEPGVSEPPPLYLVPEQLTIRGLSPGTTRCRLTLQRPFDRGPPAAEHDLRVTVLPA